MSADLLRRAAAKMRENAEAATEGRWTVTHIPESAVPSQHAIDRWYVMGHFNGQPRNQTGPAAMCEYEPATMAGKVPCDPTTWDIPDGAA